MYHELDWLIPVHEQNFITIQINQRPSRAYLAVKTLKQVTKNSSSIDTYIYMKYTTWEWSKESNQTH